MAIGCISAQRTCQVSRSSNLLRLGDVAYSLRVSLTDQPRYEYIYMPASTVVESQFESTLVTVKLF